MHEQSLAQALARDVARLLAEHGANRAASVRVTVGEFSGVEPALLQGAFEELARGAGWGETGLELNVVPLEARCDACDRRFLVPRFRFQCPACGHARTSVVRGEDLMLESVTMEQDEP
jgi:hydrogenase nickel incorporation protein HypA/HybF